MADGSAFGVFLKKFDKLGSLILVAGFYFTLAMASLHLAPSNSGISPFWPASGWALNVLMSRRPGSLLGILSAAFLANLTTDVHWMAAFGIALGKLFEGLAVRGIYEHMIRRSHDMSILQETLSLTAAAIVGSLGSAAIAYLSLAIHPSSQGFHDWGSVLTWWGADIAGILVMTPILRNHAGFRPTSALKAGALALVLGVTFLTMTTSFEEDHGGRIFILFLPMFLAALCCDRSWIVRIAAVTAIGVIIHTASGRGPFSDLAADDNVSGLQLLIISLMISALSTRDFLGHVRRIHVLPLLACGWLLSGLLFHAFHQRYSKQDNRHFDDLVVKVEQRIQSRMETYASVFDDFAGLIATEPGISLRRWQDFTDASQVLRRFPEMEGLGFVVPVEAGRKSAFESQRQHIDGQALDLHSECEAQKGPGGSYLTVLFISSLNNDPKVRGWDVSCEANRLETLEKSRTSRLPSLTPPIELRKMKASQSGFLFYVPVYSRDTFLGWISGVFVAKTIMHNMLAPYENELHFTLLHGLQGDQRPIIYQTGAPSPRIERHHTLRLIGQDFQLAIGKAPGFLSSKDLAFVWVEAFSVLLTLALAHLVSSNQLVHQRTRAEVQSQMESIAARDRLWQTLTEFAPVGIFRVNAQGDPTFSNRFWEELTGGSHRDTTAEERWNRLHPDDRKRLFPLWQNLLVSGSVLREEMRFVKPTGITWVKVHTASIIGTEGQIEGFVGVAVDVTENKLREAEIEKERIKVIHTAKMASLGEMASGIAHEINNPLAVINAIACHLTMRRAHIPEDLRPDIVKLEEMTERIAKIIRGLRSFSRNADKDPIRPVDLHSIINDTLALCQARFEASEVYLKVPPPPHLWIGCRGGQLSQILLNLLSNAHDAALMSQERWVRLDVEIRGERVQIKVVDSGPGIPAHLAPRIMEPFFTTKDVDKGTGLGLSIAKGIAEDHGGHLWLDATAPHTCFILELQIQEAATA